MTNIKTVQIPHLGGTTAAYQMPTSYDDKKPTVVLVNSFTTSSELYRAQFADKTLTDKVNLLAIELLGHGATRTARKHWTYWDTAEMNLQVLEALGIEKAFVLGTSQGGWVTVMMALLRPEKVSFTYLVSVSVGFTRRGRGLTRIDPRNHAARNIPRCGIREDSSSRMLGRRWALDAVCEEVDDGYVNARVRAGG